MQELDKKQIVRNLITSQKKHISPDRIAAQSKRICDSIARTNYFKNADCIALYYALDDEVQTASLIEEWYQSKTIVLPVITGENMNFHKYTGIENITTGKLGITEPYNTELIPPEQIDLFIVPGVAFDSNGNRIGRGKGFYDRYLTGINKPIIGICFNFQLYDPLPTEKHDVKMTIVISE
jgi:5,10-methenyltetrahydrofolate synthetase